MLEALVADADAVDDAEPADADDADVVDAVEDAAFFVVVLVPPVVAVEA